jgi:hypothetical protein
VFAQALASLKISLANRAADESLRLPAVVRAIRFLAKPGRSRRAVVRRAEVLLAAHEETSLIDAIFDGARLSKSEFIGLLESVIEGREPASHRGALRKSPPPSRPIYRFRGVLRLPRHRRRMSFCLKT